LIFHSYLDDRWEGNKWSDPANPTSHKPIKLSCGTRVGVRAPEKEGAFWAEGRPIAIASGSRVMNEGPRGKGDEQHHSLAGAGSLLIIAARAQLGSWRKRSLVLSVRTSVNRGKRQRDRVIAPQTARRADNFEKRDIRDGHCFQKNMLREIESEFGRRMRPVIRERAVPNTSCRGIGDFVTGTSRRRGGHYDPECPPPYDLAFRREWASVCEKKESTGRWPRSEFLEFFVSSRGQNATLPLLA